MGKIFGPYLKKKVSLIKFVLGLILEALSFYGKTFWALFLKNWALS
jgi:hypothetical protein